MDRLFYCLMLLAAATLQAPAWADFATFAEHHCLACHGADGEPGLIRIDQLTAPAATGTDAQNWARIVEVLESGEMPPPDHARPRATEIRRVIEQIVSQIAATAPPRKSALRRMNRREYENTVHDLLGIDVPLLDLLPEDGSSQGFDNVADGLSISSVLMEQYLEAANVAFDAVIRRIAPLPPAVRRVELMTVKENIDSVEKGKGGTIEVANSFVKFTPGWPPARLDAIHPIEDGIYRCRVALWPHDPSDRTLAVAIYVGSLFGPETRKFMGIYDVVGTPEKPRVIEFTTFIEEGHAIHIVPRIWPEHVTWRDKHEPRPGIGITWAETYGPIDQSFPSESQKALFGDRDSISMRPDQPIYMRHRKGVKTHVVESSKPVEDAERIIREFIPRAFRRPVGEEEMAPFLQLTLGKHLSENHKKGPRLAPSAHSFRKGPRLAPSAQDSRIGSKLASGRTFEQAVRAGITAVLCAPQFLLLNQAQQVDDYTLASRLSYFFWSSMPDAELLDLAASGQLSQPTVRHQQVERMLADPKSKAFIENFTGQWLDLREIEFTTPDGKLYPEFDPLLQEAMLGETIHFFQHMLTEDLSVLNFIDSDWTFLNERLARHYGIPGVQGHERFKKVSLPDDSIRGGILTQASLLKVTANGTTTSPVLRGVWVLDNLLGRAPAPPPPGVAGVEPDIRGATTIRQQLEKHRDNSSCASCHRSIDPPGFALEVFDAIGGERQFYRSLGEGKKIAGNKNYRQGPDVDSGGTLADGRQFANFQEFRERLLSEQQTVARAIATKLLIYGTGRQITIAERPLVERVVKQTASNHYGLKSMIHAVVDSELFLAP